VTNQLEDLAALTKLRPTISEILQASPFDTNKNIGGLLTESVFFKHLFVESQSFRDLSQQLMKTLKDDLENIQMLVLDGFSGTGKTTFIKGFIRTNDLFHFIYIDFNAFARAVETMPQKHVLPSDVHQRLDAIEAKLSSMQDGDDPALHKTIHELKAVIDSGELTTNPIESTMKGFLDRHSNQGLINCLYFVYSKIKPLSVYFSKRFIEQTAITRRQDISQQYHLLVNACDFNDIFMLFFIYFLREAPPDKTVLVFFDNLDAINLAYLSDYFKQSFGRVLYNATAMAQDKKVFDSPVDLSRRFKFVFCLRDSNSSLMNTHISDSIRHIHFHVRFDGDLYTEIIKKRTTFFEQTFGSAGATTSPSLAAQIIERFAHDKYFKQVVVPLFNSDFRRLSLALFDIAKSSLAGDGSKEAIRLANTNHENFLDLYGLRGSLLFGLVHFLREDNFLTNQPFSLLHGDTKEGYCMPSRMILTVLLNHSNLRQSSDILDPRIRLSPVPLADILSDAAPVYGIKETIALLIEAFLLHERNWVHLVTFRNKEVTNSRAFDEDILDIALQEKDSQGERVLAPPGLERFRSITVTLNPAGFVFLKNLLPHFEFYSAIAGNARPLFSLGCERTELGHNYIFESYISKVQVLVKRNLSAMRAFFRNIFEGRLRWTPDQYRKSSFFFKHTRDGVPPPRGIFHSDRILTAHIDYIDKFRLHLLQNVLGKDRQAVEGAQINRWLIGAIESYMQMFELSVDDDLPVMRQAFRDKIQRIRSSQFQDFTTPIADVGFG